MPDAINNGEIEGGFLQSKNENGDISYFTIL
jgi:hypothetical protein